MSYADLMELVAGMVAVQNPISSELAINKGIDLPPRIMPQVLQQLMRQESIETTLKYYVGRNAEATAAVLYAAVPGNIFGNRAANSSSGGEKAPSQPIDATRLSK